MESITGICEERLSFEQNEEGMFDVMIIHDNKQYRTGFIFDDIKVMSEFQLRVCQTDYKGNKKYGLIAVCDEDEIYLPCIFDRIKPFGGFKGSVLQAYIGDEEFIIRRRGNVFSREFWDLQKELLD